jgi:hypothetical protein
VPALAVHCNFKLVFVTFEKLKEVGAPGRVMNVVKEGGVEAAVGVPPLWAVAVMA